MMAKGKKKSVGKQTKKQSTKKVSKKFSVKKLIIAICVIAVIAAVTVFIGLKACSDSAKTALNDTEWYSASATDASGDQVDMGEIYQVKYSNYQGGLKFTDDNRFQFWLSPGDPADGLHSGVYELKDDKIVVIFDEGTQTEFSLVRENGEVKQIQVNYDDYKVTFLQSK